MDSYITIINLTLKPATSTSLAESGKFDHWLFSRDHNLTQPLLPFVHFSFGPSLVACIIADQDAIILPSKYRSSAVPPLSQEPERHDGCLV